MHAFVFDALVQTLPYSEVVQVYPPMQDEPLTSLQKKLKKKLGVNAYPFILQVGLTREAQAPGRHAWVTRPTVPFVA